MEYISSRIYGNTDGLYVDPCNCQSYIDYTKAINYKQVDMEGVNQIDIYRENDGTMRIIGVSGYTYNKGLFYEAY